MIYFCGYMEEGCLALLDYSSKTSSLFIFHSPSFIIGYLLSCRTFALFICISYMIYMEYAYDIYGNMAFKTTHNKDENLPQFMKSPQLIFSHN